MADLESDKIKVASKKARLPRKRKQPLTVRQQAEKRKASSSKVKTSKLSAVSILISKVRSLLRRQYFFHNVSDKKIQGFFTKPRKFWPKYFKNSWKELLLVKWPTFKTVVKLTFAVFAFVVVFTLFITLIDYGFDKIFRALI